MRAPVTALQLYFEANYANNYKLFFLRLLEAECRLCGRGGGQCGCGHVADH